MQIATATVSPLHEVKSLPVSRSRVVFYLSLLILLVICLSLFVFANQSLRLDEAQSLWQTSHSTGKMISIVAEDVHVPFYHFLLQIWRQMFGNSIVAARMLSLLFFVLLIPAIYSLGKLAYSRTIGLWCALLVAISPFLNWYGNEIRMYSLFALLTVLNQYFFMSVFVRHKRGEPVTGKIWFGYTITLLLGLFTHYFFVLNAITQVVFFLIRRKAFPAGALKMFILIAILAVLVFSPWLYYVITSGSASNSQPALSKPTTVDLFNTFSQFIFGFQNDHINTILLSLWPILVLLIFLALRRNQRVENETIYLFFALFLPILLVFAVSSEVRPIYLTRYLVLTLPALYLLISWILHAYPKRLSNALKGILVAAMAVMLVVEVVNASTPVKENYREASFYLTENVSPQDVVVVSAPFTLYPVEYYYRGPASIQTLPLWDRYGEGAIPAFDAERLPEEVEQIKDDHRNLWLLLSYDQGYEEDIKSFFDSNFDRLESRNFSPGLNLYVYKLRYD